MGHGSICKLMYMCVSCAAVSLAHSDDTPGLPVQNLAGDARKGLTGIVQNAS